MVLEDIQVGEDLVIAKARQEDALEVFALVDSCRDYLRQWFSWVDQSLSVRDVVAFIRRSEAQERAGNGVQCTIRYRGQLVGVIGCVYVDRVHSKAEIGYWLGEIYQGKGIMTQAVRALTDHSFAVWDLNRVELRVATGNSRSRAIAERLGFKQEGVHRESEWVNDRFLDTVSYSMLRRDWEQLKARL